VIAALVSGCGKTSSDAVSAVSAQADSSASGAAASAVGGALSGSSSGGAQALYRANDHDPVHSFWSLIARAARPEIALASSLCPTFQTTGLGCAASGSNMWLTDSDCTFSGKATWTGVQELTMSSGSAACGTFPNPGASATLYRQVVTASGSSTPGTLQLVSDNATATIDDATNNLGNFDGDSISTIINGGYGSAVHLGSSGTPDSVVLKRRVFVTGSFDHSLDGTLSVSETAGVRTISGSISVYHNRLKVIGTSNFANVMHSDQCCLPTSGTITTSFSAGSNVSPTLIGSAMVGHSEVLTFTGCGTANLTNTDGSSVSVTLNRCF